MFNIIFPKSCLKFTNFDEHSPEFQQFLRKRPESEGWQELLSGTYPTLEHLGRRKWTVLPKIASARTIDKLHDLEMTNVVRRTLARMANRVLDELFSAGGLHQAQQAFFS